MNTTMVEKLNKQLNNELFSAYKYLAMATYFKQISMDGFGKYMQEQAQEEMEHARRIYDYLLLANQKIVMERIESTDANWINPINVFEDALSHEKFVTGNIVSMYEYAQSINDHATVIFLQWFVTEQVEEENKFVDMIEKLQSFQDCTCGLYSLDKYLMGHTAPDPRI